MTKSEKIELLKSKMAYFRHSHSEKVQFFEVDSFGVVHNLRYFYWLEWARTNYLNDIGHVIKNDTFINELPLMTVHSEIDHYMPVRFFDTYKVLTRVAFIRNSSIGFENLIINSDNEILASASAVLVLIDKNKNEPDRIPDMLREQISNYEGANVRILDKEGK